MVDAGNKIERSLELVFSEPVFEITSSIACFYTLSSVFSCEERRCLILATVSSDVPDSTTVTCELRISAKSHPVRGREYNFVETVEIGRSPAVEVSFDPVHSSPSVGSSLNSSLRMNITEVEASVEVEVLCGTDEDFVLTDVVLLESLETVLMVVEKRDVESSCAKISLSFSPSGPTEQLQYQSVVLQSNLILTKMSNDLAVVSYIIKIGSETSDLFQKISTCTPDFSLESSLLPPESSYFKSDQEIWYKTVISNTASCSFFIKTLNYFIQSTDDSYIDERNVTIQSGEELEFLFNIKLFPEKLMILEPDLTVTVGTSLLSEYSLDIIR